MKPEFLGASIVALGSFNPAIMTADWLEQSKLIGGDDAGAARSGESYFVTRQITQIETDWFNLSVGVDKMSLTSKAALNPAIKDLAVGIFTLLPHTPIRAVGLNFHAHYKMLTEEDYHRIGDVLAPKMVWSSLLGEEYTAGLETLTIKLQECKRGEQPETADAKRFIVEPSAKITNGVYLSLNDHHQILNDVEGLSTAEKAAEIVSSEWELAWRTAPSFFEKILESCEKA